MLPTNASVFLKMKSWSSAPRTVRCRCLASMNCSPLSRRKSIERGTRELYDAFCDVLTPGLTCPSERTERSPPMYIITLPEIVGFVYRYVIHIACRRRRWLRLGITVFRRVLAGLAVPVSSGSALVASLVGRRQ